MVFAFVCAAAVVGSVAIESDLTCPTSEQIAEPLPPLLETTEGTEATTGDKKPRFRVRLTDVGEFLYLRVNQKDNSLLCERSFEKPTETAADRCSGLARAIAIAVSSCLPSPTTPMDVAPSALPRREPPPHPRWALGLRAGAAYDRSVLGLGELDVNYSRSWWMLGGRFRGTSATTRSVSLADTGNTGQVRWHRQALLVGPGWHSNPTQPLEIQAAMRFGAAWFKASSLGFDDDWTRHRLVPAIAPSLLARHCWGAWCLEADLESNFWLSPLRLEVAERSPNGDTTTRKHIKIPVVDIGVTLGAGVRF